MERVVVLTNKLQQICTQMGDVAGAGGLLVDKLSSIVVVGGQSSGKSSVLEAVVGRDFLPRGTGIVTRRPLVLSLVHLDDPGALEYGEFMHRQGQRFHNFGGIMQEISGETERHLAKIRRPVSPVPIYLTVFSPNVPNLTLVDMPGLTKVAIEGQPANIVRELEEMCKQYIQGDNAIILAVTPANADLATSDALRLAREVDPSGARTIGVLTKVDIMDKGTDCRDILLGRALRLRHGWVAVVNRGQADLNRGASLAEARAHEAAFFDTSTAYKDLPNTGTEYLAEKLSRHLINEITRRLPEVQGFVDEKISGYRRQLKALGSDIGDNRGKMLHLILVLCQKVETAFTRIVDGGAGGGERILEVFDVKLKDAIFRLPFERILTLRNVRTTINAADGYQPHLVAPEAGYRRLIEDGLTLLREPSAKAVEQTHQILRGSITMAINEVKELQRFVNLKSEILAHAVVTLDRLKESSEAMVRTLVDMEGSYLSANFFREIVAAESFNYHPSGFNPQFVTLTGDILLEQRYDHLSAADAHLARIADHVSAYLQIVRSQLLATVPKAVVHSSVVPAKEVLLGGLQEEVAGKEEGALRVLLSESEETAARRRELRRQLELMERAAAEIMNFRV